MHKLTNEEAINVLKSWTALEVLSPQTFQKFEDLAYGDKKLIATLNSPVLAWENGGETPPKNKKLYYQVVIGVLDYSKAIQLLLDKYNDKNEEKIRNSGYAVLAVALIDQQGNLLKENSR